MDLNNNLDKVNFLLVLANKGECSEKELKTIKTLLSEKTDNMVVGRFMGYPVAAYAFATLKWIGSKDALNLFDNEYNKNNTEQEKAEIEELIERKVYLQY